MNSQLDQIEERRAARREERLREEADAARRYLYNINMEDG
jgi:hypothetical protein